MLGKCKETQYPQIIDKTKNFQQFKFFKTVYAHYQPIASCEFNTNGKIFITSSYDMKCKLWYTFSGKQFASLKGHTSVVYSIAFNYPKCSLIATGSWDETAKIWNFATRKCQTLIGHSLEVVCILFDPHSLFVATASVDKTARLWDVGTRQQIVIYNGHLREVVYLKFNTNGDKLLTGSYDRTARVWDVRSGNCIHILDDHKDKYSKIFFELKGNYYASIYDKSCKIWDVETGKCLHILKNHQIKILRLFFNSAGTKLAAFSSQNTIIVYNVQTGEIISKFQTISGDIVKIQFHPSDDLIIIASVDNTTRIYSETGECLQVLDGHSDEMYNFSINFGGDIFITGSNICRIWKQN